MNAIVIQYLKGFQGYGIMYDLGSRIRENRNKRGLTQEELAKRINRCKSAVSGYETNAQIPPTEVLVSIANVLNVSIAELIEVDDAHTLSTSMFTETQKEIIDLLVAEFVSPSSRHDGLSKRQTEILSKLLQLFASEQTV